ncbi:MAG: 2-oxoacid:acceptor oxidoreductase family protein [Candidatus Latescibacterota bacterium]
MMGIDTDKSPETKVLISGHGGQGIVFMATLLAHAAMSEGKEVTFFPSYGAEMRGGTAHASVVLSTRLITSPIVETPDILIALNAPSLLRFERQVRPGGQLFLDHLPSGGSPTRDDLDIILVAATELAEKLGNPKTVNMVMLGAVAGMTGLVSLSTLSHSLGRVLPAHRQSLLETNRRALLMAADTMGKAE